MASALTTASYIPQLLKAWQTGETGDLSLKMLFTLLAGLLLWVAYGFRQGDWVIVASNTISSALLAAILVLKIQGTRR
jgi:MtN3 and saliva related transmembrane protein